MLIKNSREVASLLLPGVGLGDPSKRGIVPRPFGGKRFPTFLRLRGVTSRPFLKKCPTNRRCEVEFDTDAENDYLSRTDDPGVFQVSSPGHVRGISLWNGILTLTLWPNGDLVANTRDIDVALTTPNNPGSLREAFQLQIAPPAEPSGGGGGGKKQRQFGL